MELASFRLEGITRTWYKMHIADAIISAPRLIWDEFKNAFVDRFLLETVRKTKGYEFERLVQTPCVTVVEYDVKFTELSIISICKTLKFNRGCDDQIVC